MAGNSWAPVGDGPVRRACTPHCKVLRTRRVGAALGGLLRKSSQLNLKRWQDCFVYRSLVFNMIAANSRVLTV